MIPMSDAFYNAMVTNGRQSTAKVIFNIVDTDAATDATITASSENDFSKRTQVSNAIRDASGKYATFENDYWKLDGSFNLPPKSTESGYEVGWWSNELSSNYETISSKNILGVDGDCESLTNMSSTGTHSIDSSNYLFGTRSVKLAADATGTYYEWIECLAKVNVNKYYLATAYVKNTDATNSYFRCWGVGGSNPVFAETVTDTNWVRYGAVIQPSDFVGLTNFRIGMKIVSPAIAKYGNIDGIMLNEITFAEYSQGASAIMANYPFTGTPSYIYRNNMLGAAGDFPNTIGWGGSDQTLAASTNRLIITGTGTQAVFDAVYSTTIPITAGDKIFVIGTMLVTNGVALEMSLRYTGTGSGSTVAIATQTTPVINQYYPLAAVFTENGTHTGNYRFNLRTNYADAATANGKVTVVKQFMAINLTKIYGPGNEITDVPTLLTLYPFSTDTAPTLTTSFSKDHSSIGLSITFDNYANEYATSFNITFKNSSGVVISSVDVVGNTLSSYVLTQTVNNYRSIVITIYKWCNPYRRARITEIDFGVIQTYTASDITNLEVQTDLDTISDTISSNEMTFSIKNLLKNYNIMNPTGIYTALQRRQKIMPFIGVYTSPTSVEYCQVGAYYLTDWRSDDSALTATFTARDMLDVLADGIYRKGKYQTATLYDLAVDVLTDAGVTDYSIDTALQSITTIGCVPLCSHREALQTIAIAGMSVCYCNNVGTLIIKQLTTATTGKTLGFNTQYNSPLITLGKLYNTIDVLFYNYNPRVGSETVYSGVYTINGTVDVWIEYIDIKCPAQTVSAIVSGGSAVLNSATYYSNAAKLNITATGDVTITATGTVLDVSNSLYRYTDPLTPSAEQLYILKFDNRLVSSKTIASNITVWALAEAKKRYNYELNWIQNPMFEPGDIVTVQDDFSANKKMRITEQQLRFNGAFEGKTLGIGDGT